MVFDHIDQIRDQIDFSGYPIVEHVRSAVALDSLVDLFLFLLKTN